jgi:PKD repeat protein
MLLFHVLISKAMKKFILLLVLLSAFLQTVKSETEPNDSTALANTLVLNTGQTGGLTGSDLNDWFVLHLTQSGILTLTFQKTGGGNGTLYFRDGEMAGDPEISSLYISFWESPPEGWTLSYPVLAGKYYVQINKNTDAINYILTATLTPSNFSEDLEPNNTPAQAITMPPNSTVSGNLHYYGAGEGADPEDWYKMVVPQGGILKLTIHKKGGGLTWIYFKDGESGGNPEITNYYTGAWESPPEGWAWSYPVLAGTYYFQVANGNGVVDYLMTASLSPPAFPEDTEPNNILSQASVIPPNGTVSGTLHYYGAGEAVDGEDWYKMSITQGGILSMVIHKKGLGNAWIYFKDGEMPNQPDISNYYLSYFESPPEGWTWSYPLLAGNYYFQVSGGGNVVDYQFISTLILPQWGNDPEPNDDTSTASPFPTGSAMGGTVGYYRPNYGTDNWDWFKVVTTEYGQLSFSIHKKGFNNVNLRLRDSSAEITTHYLGFGDLTTSFSKILPAGTYYLGVEKLGGDIQYQIQSSLLPAPVADFNFKQTGNVFAFENTSLHEASYYWSFDDGGTATTVNAYHEYAEPGNFNVCLIATNVAGADTTCHIATMPGVARALPAEGGNTGDVTLQVFGGGLDTSYVAKIMNGGIVIASSNFTGFGGKSSIYVRFDLRNKPVGNYQLLIERSGGPSYTVPGGFNIVPGIAADPWVSIGGRNRILYNTWTTYTVNYGNRGNVDARLVPVWFEMNTDPDLEVEFPNVHFNMPDTLVGEPESEGIYMETDSLFGQPYPARVYPFILPVIPAGTEASFKIRIKTGGNLKIKAWTEKPWRQSPINQNKVECFSEALAEAPEDLGLTEDKVLCMQVMTVVILDREQEFDDRAVYNGRMTEAQRTPFVTLFLRVIRATSKICGVNDPADRKRVSEWVTKVILNYWLREQRTPSLVEFKADDRSGESCPIEFEPQNPTATSLTAVSSLDPNEKSGPSGFGTDNYLRDTRSFPYTIHFENVDTATAPAHTVVVTDQLNTAKFDLTTFSFDKVFIGDSILFVEPGLREFVLDKKLNNLGVTARVHGKLDMQSGLITWTFRSLDAATLDEIEDPDIGFLPPNVLSPEGQGAVSYFVKLKNAPQHGEQVKNSAGIVFDNNPAILTNEHRVTFDLAAPQSAIQPIAPVQNTAQFVLNWSGTDAGSGIQHYNIYYVLNGTDTVLWRGGITGTSALFTGEGSNTYEFYSVAVDNVGNVEETPGFPDAVTTIITGTEDQVDQTTDLVIFPNPVSDQLTICNRGAAEGCLTIVQPDGRIVASMQLQANSRRQFSVAELPQGLLLWRWAPGCGGNVYLGKVMIMR